MSLKWTLLSICENYRGVITIDLHPSLSFEHEDDRFPWPQQGPFDIILLYNPIGVVFISKTIFNVRVVYRIA